MIGRYLSVGFLFLALSGCAGDAFLLSEVSTASVTVDSAQCPARVSAEIHAIKPTPCHEALPAKVSRKDKEVFVRIELEQVHEECIQVIEEFTTVVDLGTFAPGAYELVVENDSADHRSPFVVDATCTK